MGGQRGRRMRPSTHPGGDAMNQTTAPDAADARPTATRRGTIA